MRTAHSSSAASALVREKYRTWKCAYRNTEKMFNLIQEPWLPAQRRSGAVEWIQPWKVTHRIHEDPFVAFAWPRADFCGASLEFLIGLLSTAAAPTDDDEWHDWWDAPPRPDDLEQNFQRVAEAFDLDGSGPRFLQDLDRLDGVKTKPITSLLIDAPGDQTLKNNADLFVKRSEPAVFCRASAAMALYTLCAYAPSGGAGHRTSIRGGGPMTTLVVADNPKHGNTLWGHLWPNAETKEQIEERSPDSGVSEDMRTIFPWLRPTRVSGPKGKGRVTSPVDVHPLQVYWGMPRRIRLDFEDGGDNFPCSLTGKGDSIVVRCFRTKNYGTNYSEGFQHPLTPYYRQNAQSANRLPVHPQPGGISYRLWPGVVLDSANKLRTPAQTVLHWKQSRAHYILNSKTRIATFGYDMDNMKARAWTEGEMPVWHLSQPEARELMNDFVLKLTAAASTVVRLLIRAVKSTLWDRPSDASGDYGFIAERLYRETEAQFYALLQESRDAIQTAADTSDPTGETRRKWASTLAQAAMLLFDEHAPTESLEDGNMERQVKARFFLALALNGRGKEGKLLFERDLGIVSPKSLQERENKGVAA